MTETEDKKTEISFGKTMALPFNQSDENQIIKIKYKAKCNTPTIPVCHCESFNR